MFGFLKSPDTGPPERKDEPEIHPDIRVDTGTNNPFINEEATKVAERILRSERPRRD